jgi:hypothetical protein
MTGMEKVLTFQPLLALFATGYEHPTDMKNKENTVQIHNMHLIVYISCSAM